MNGILVDTDVAIDFLRGALYAKHLLRELWGENRAHLAILSVYELYAGMRPSEKESTESFINGCIIESVTLDVARRGASWYQDHRRRGTTLAAVDCLIAGIALERELTIATRNAQHYPDEELRVSLEPYMEGATAEDSHG